MCVLVFLCVISRQEQGKESSHEEAVFPLWGGRGGGNLLMVRTCFLSAKVNSWCFTFIFPLVCCVAGAWSF